ncbi:hypothetical protein KZX46_20925 [Polymorphobacter sp. PAMC 29334]|uniref:DUF6998 domain-containing protein n=1 Tax=Polymorphobacter sp. PAMC 29334 TaxID=2862331 RepID=UPI001C77BDA6|nr:hypothetical protein [Polymorphobacter sp. PAMC 29334]QYE35143.1 hypothetical protein KZX46_20925 [Polymorphobacter sp. PAMC 29334]
MKPLSVDSSKNFSLKPPSVVMELVHAAKVMREHYATLHGNRLLFTFDGNLVGDMGEALAVEYFGMTLDRRCGEGADGFAPDRTTVQVKATGTGRGAVFRDTELHADRLLFFSIDFTNCTATVVYNGMEARVRAKLNRP